MGLKTLVKQLSRWMALLLAASVARGSDYTNTTSGGYNANIWGGGNPGNTNIADTVFITNGAVVVQFAYAASNDFINVNNLGNFTNTLAFGLSGATISLNAGGTLLNNSTANTLSGAIVRLNGGTLYFNADAGNLGVAATPLGSLQVYDNSTITNFNANGSASIYRNALLDFTVGGKTLTLAGQTTGGGIQYQFDSLMVSNSGTLVFSKTGSSTLLATVTNVTLTAGSTLMVTNATGAGTGTLTFNGNNAGIAGAVDVRSGATVVANASNALGNATVTIHNGGTFSVAAGYAAGRTNTVNAGGTLAVGSANASLTNTVVYLNGGVLYFNAEPWTYAAGPLGILRVLESSTITNLNGNNSGGTIINDSLDFTGAGKTLTLAGNIGAGGAMGFRFNSVTISNDATLVFSRTGAGAGLFTATFSNLTLSASNTLIFANLNSFNTGTLTLLGNNSGVAGSLDLRTNTIVVAGDNNTLGKATVSINGGARLNLNASNALGTATVTINNGATVSLGAPYSLGTSTNTLNAGGWLIASSAANNVQSGAVLRLNGGTVYNDYQYVFNLVTNLNDIQVLASSTITNRGNNGSANPGGSLTHSSLDFTGNGAALTLAADITGVNIASLNYIFNRVNVTNDATLVLSRTGTGAGALAVQFSNLTLAATKTLTVTNTTGVGTSSLTILGTNNFGVTGTIDVRSGALLQAGMSNSLGSGSILVNSGGTLTPTVAFGLGSSTSTINTGGWLTTGGLNGGLTGAVVRLNGGTLFHNYFVDNFAITPFGSLQVLANSTVTNFSQSGAASNGGTFTYDSLDFTAPGAALTLAASINGTSGGLRYSFAGVTVSNDATVILARSGTAGTGLGVLFSNTALAASRTLTVTNFTGANATLTFLGTGTGMVGAVDIRTGAWVAAPVSNALGTATVFVNGGTLTVTDANGLGGSAVVVSNGFMIGSVATVNLSGDSRASLVTGSGSLWTNTGTLVIGTGAGMSNTLTVANGGTLFAPTALNIGVGASGSNQLIISGGTVWIPTALRATNAGNVVVFNSGTLHSSGTFISNNVFTVGDGVNVARFNTIGGTHAFGSGIIIASNSYLTGTGTILGPTTLTNGGIISAGLGLTGIGVLTANNLNWLSGGILQVDLQNFGVAGADYDFLRLTGALTNSGAGFVVNLNTNGLGAAFNSANDYQLLIAVFASQFGVNPASFAVNNNFGASGWQVTTVGTNLYLTYYGTAAVTPDFVWGFGSGKWSDGPRWTNGVAPAADGLKLQFGTNTLTQFTATNTTINAVNALVLDGGAGLPITNFLVGNSLTISGEVAAIVQQNQGAFVISNGLVLATNLTVRGNGLGTVTLASNITGTAGQFTKQGAFNLVLRGSNTFVAPVLMDSPGGGMLTLANAYALGANSLTVSNGIVVAGAGYTIGNGWNDQMVLITGPASTWSNAAAFNIGSGAATNNVVTIANNGSLFASAINIGNGVAATGNGLIISNSGVVRGGVITVGNGGATGNFFNALGGVASNGAITVGGTSSGFNTMTVTNVTLLSGALTVGNGSSNNQATVLNDGTWNLLNNTVTIGTGAATGNVLNVLGGTLTNVNSITLGTAGSGGNSIIATNAKLFTGAGSTGMTIGSGTSNNAVSVLASVTWNMLGGAIIVGSTTASSNNVLVVNGGTITNLVNGFSNQALSMSGIHGQVLITNGGRIAVGTAGSAIGPSIGGGVSSRWNTVTITGPNSILDATVGGSTMTVGGGATSMYNSVSIVASGTLRVADRFWLGLGYGAISNSVTVSGTGSVFRQLSLSGFDLGGGVNNQFNTLTVSNGGYFYNERFISIGSGGVGASNNAFNVGGLGLPSVADMGNGGVVVGAASSGYNTLTVTNATLYSRNGSFVSTVGGASSNNTATITAGGIWNFSAINGLTIGSGAATGNRLLVDNGTVTNLAALAVTIGSGGAPTNFNNRIVIRDGGQWYGGAVTVGSGGSTGNLYQVGGTGAASSVSNATIVIGGAASGLNQMLVTNATLLSGAVTVGNGSSNNTVTIAGDATWTALGSTVVAGSGAATGNVLWVQAGGLLEAGGLATGAGAGNLITNSGGIFQFTTATPAISGSVVLVDGTVSFRNLSTGLNLTNNWRGSQLTNLTFAGNNTLRLNNSTATNTLAGGYTFNTGLGATNYTRLEVINGTTGVRGAGVTIGASGSFLASNTVATFSGAFTNNGIADLANAIVIFSNSLHVAGTLRGNGTIIGTTTVGGVIAPGFSPGTITFSNNFTLTGTAQMELFSGGNLGSSDKINVLAVLAGGGLVQITTNGTFVIAAGDKWDLFDWTSGTPTFTFDGSAVALDSGLSWDTSQLNIDGTIAIIPEPGTWLLVLLGGVGLFIVRRRR